MRLFVFLSVSLLPLAVHSEPAQTSGEILVTGEFRETDLDKLPASVSVIGADEIEARGAHHLEDVLGAAANVNIAGGSSRSRFFQIRGIGERSQFTEALNPSVGLIVDGVDFSDSAATATVFDVEQMEIFHGPQGTRYGANALAGLINIATRGPTDAFEANVGLEAADYDTRTLRAAVSGPLSERVSVRVAGQHHSSDGFLRNDFLGRDDTNKRDELSFRSKLHWAAGANTTVDAMLGYADVDNGYDAFSLDNNRRTLSDEPGRDAQHTVFGSVHVDWEGSDVFAVQALTSGASSSSTYGYDEDWTFVGFDPDGYSSTDYYFRDRRNLTAEIKLLSKDAGRLFAGASDWVAGLYGLKREEDLRRVYTFLPGPFRSNFDVDRFAVFGELQTAIGSRNRLTTGARYERHESMYRDSENVTFSPADDLFGWRVSLARDLRDELMAYASVSRGYKTGGFNTDGTLDEDLRQYKPETLINYEIGLKGRLLEQRLITRLAVFYMQRSDMQVFSSILRPRPNGSTEFIDFIGNAAEGNNAGVEAEVVFQATDALELAVSLGLLRSEYKEYVNELGENLDGREQTHAPEYQFAARGRYTFATHWYTELGVEGRDDFYFSDLSEEHSRAVNARSQAYALVSAALGFARGPWEGKLWGRNLGDEDYFVRGYVFGNDPRIAYDERTYTQLGNPRQVGITVNYSFK